MRGKSSDVGVRDRLLDAADRLFYQEGVRAVGIDRVLSEADAAKASLYQHFGSKDQLVASYLDRKVKDARTSIEAYLADTPPAQRALTFFDWVVEWAESKDFRGCPLQHAVSELTDAAHPALAIAHEQRAWFAERLREWTTAAGVKDAKATARALMVLFDGAVVGSEVDGPQRASDARWMARKLLAG
jgi:AcrR family transcriptional regulator